MPRVFAALFGLLLFAFGAPGANAAAHIVDVEVSFSGRLTENMSTLNAIEKEREENFRQFYDDYRASRTRTARRFDTVKFGDVAWAGETLIPNIENFTVENFIAALVNENLRRAGFEDVDGAIRVHVDRLKVANHSLSFLTSNDTYVIGTFEHVGENGQVIKSVKVSANFVYDITVDNDYSGPAFAFSVTDPSHRVGPALTRFVQKGLQNLFDSDAFYGPILVGS